MTTSSAPATAAPTPTTSPIATAADAMNAAQDEAPIYALLDALRMANPWPHGGPHERRDLLLARTWCQFLDPTQTRESAALELVTRLHGALQMVSRCPERPLVGPAVVIDTAAAGGFASVVRYLHTHRPHEPPSPEALTAAAAHGHLHVVAYLHTHFAHVGGGGDTTTEAIDGAAEHGHLPVVRFLWEHCGHRLSAWGLAACVALGHTAILDYWATATAAAAAADDDDDDAAEDGLLPPSLLEHAAYHGRLESLQWLVAHLRPGALATARSSLLAIDAAIRGHQGLEVVRFLHAHGLGRATPEALDGAAGRGDLAVVRFLHAHRRSPDDDDDDDDDDGDDGTACTTRAMDDAAANGHLDVVAFLHEHRPEGCTTMAMDHAAAHGHLSVVRFLRERRLEGCTTAAMDLAASNGHLDVVAFLHEHRPEGCTTMAMDHAAAHGHVPVLRFLHESRSEGFTPQALVEAVSNGHVGAARYLREHCHANVETLQSSKIVHECIRRGHLEMLRYLQEDTTSTRIPQWALARAASSGQRAIVEYLFQHLQNQSRGPGDEDPESVRTVCGAIEAAAEAPDNALELLRVFEAILGNGAYATRALDLAAAKGDLAIVAYLHAHNHPGSTVAAMDQAATNGHFEVVRFLHKRRHEGCTTQAMDGAATNGHLRIVEYLHRHRHEGCTAAAIDGAAANGYSDVVEFLLENRTEGYSYVGVDAAKKHDHLEVVALLPDYRVLWKYPGATPASKNVKREKNRRG